MWNGHFCSRLKNVLHIQSIFELELNIQDKSDLKNFGMLCTFVRNFFQNMWPDVILIPVANLWQSKH